MSPNATAIDYKMRQQFITKCNNLLFCVITNWDDYNKVRQNYRREVGLIELSAGQTWMKAEMTPQFYVKLLQAKLNSN